MGATWPTASSIGAIVMTRRSVFATRSRGIVDDGRRGMARAIGEAGSPLIEPLGRFES